MSAALASCLRLAVAAGLAGLASSACFMVATTQRWPEPMEAARHPLPPGDSAAHLAGPEEVTVIRHADPVQVRPAGSLSSFPMAFYDKKTRLTAGGAVLVAPGGRAEVLWAEGSSIVVFGRGLGWIGSPSRGEPLFEFQDLDRARLDLREGEQVRLLGGAILRGPSGPYLVERVRSDLLRVRNQSKGPLGVAFRDESFELGPGEGLLLPLLSAGGAPFNEDPALQRISGPGFQVLVRGELESLEAGGVRLRASGAAEAPSEMSALGVHVRLAPGEEAWFTSLEQPDSATRPTGPEREAAPEPPGEAPSEPSSASEPEDAPPASETPLPTPPPVPPRIPPPMTPIGTPIGRART